MNLRSLRSVALGAAGITLIGCFLPTEACGCSYPPPFANVVATLLDSGHQPVTGARVYAMGFPEDRRPAQPFFDSRLYQNEPDGTYRGRIVNMFGPNLSRIHATIVLNEGADTVMVVGGFIQFHAGTSRPDTARITLQLPAK